MLNEEQLKDTIKKLISEMEESQMHALVDKTMDYISVGVTKASKKTFTKEERKEYAEAVIKKVSKMFKDLKWI